MRQPECNEVSQALLEIALGLPTGWRVTIEGSGQICLLPPIGSDLAYLGERRHGLGHWRVPEAARTRQEKLEITAA